jgi:predicted DNA-binding transcriptional regulator AlpA
MRKAAISLNDRDSKPKLPEALVNGGDAGRMQCLTEGQTAEILGCSRALLRKWRRIKGGGPRFFKLGHLVRYSLRDLQAWLEAHRADE